MSTAGASIRVLGSGGASRTPRPGCTCRVCVEAREKGPPYVRTGPSVFVHGPDLLFDTPEESAEQLDRAGITGIGAGFYSHWHPDHTMGRRVWETRALDWRTWPPAPAPEPTPVYLPAQVAADFRMYLGHAEHLAFLEERGYVRVVELRDGDVVQVGGWDVRPFRLAEDYVYAFELTRGATRLLLALDELHGWTPPAALRGLDLAVLPMGLCEHHPLTGERRMHPDHPLLRSEATFAQTLELVRSLEAGRVVLLHVEEQDGIARDELGAVAERLGPGLVFADDDLVVAV